MKTLKHVAIFLMMAFLAACGPSAEERSAMEKSKQDSVMATASSSAAVENPTDTTRKFIRKADLRFKVKNVIHATYSIEDIVAGQGGFVTLTRLNSAVDRVAQTAVSSDSILETTWYTVSNTMTLRVPNTKLDTTLKLIARHIAFLDYRVIEAEDVALQLLSNRLTMKRTARNEARLEKAIENRGKKLTETTRAEELLLEKQEQGDLALISNLGLRDQIEFSTVTLQMYQSQSLMRELIANEKNIRAWEPGFGTRLLDALAWGWTSLQEIFLFLARIWGLILAAVLVYLFYRWMKRRGNTPEN